MTVPATQSLPRAPEKRLVEGEGCGSALDAPGEHGYVGVAEAVQGLQKDCPGSIEPCAGRRSELNPSLKSNPVAAGAFAFLWVLFSPVRGVHVMPESMA